MKSRALSFVMVPLLVAAGACSQNGPNVSTTGAGGSTGTGGATSSGGAGGDNTGGGGGGAGGGGTGATDGSSNNVTVDGIAGVPNANGAVLKDSWMLFPCYGAPTTQDCITNPPGTACPNQNASLPFEQQGISFTEDFTVGGTPGTMYMMTIQVNGITEAKYYMGGTRADGNASPPNPDATNGINMFYTGGMPVNVENYNVYKITVKDTTGTEIQHYYLNSMPTGTTTLYENHNTFPEGYMASFPVMGGGTISYLETDRNCHAIDNCGAGRAGAGTPCAVNAGRTIPNEPNAVIPTMWHGQAVSSLNTRNGAMQPFHAQVIHITVLSVAAM
jgi:hypothetical protein